MRKVLLTILALVLILGALGAAGFAGYRYGYAQAVQATPNGITRQVAPGFGFGPRMPMHNFGFDRDFGRHEFPMMGRGMMGFGVFGPLMFLLRILFWALVIWALYMLFTRSGWRLTRETTTTTTTPPAAPATTVIEEEIKEEQ
jgi:uncharacterized membrane protein